MSRISQSEALNVIADALDESHDGLVRFTHKLQTVSETPALWWRDFAIHVSDRANVDLSSWPLTRYGDASLMAQSFDGQTTYTFEREALRSFCKDRLGLTFSAAEFQVFVDLAAGDTLETSALRANVTTATRRKQVQTCFRKAGLSSQAELVSLANRVTERFVGTVHKSYQQGSDSWSSYMPFLPETVRCAVMQRSADQPVRYLEMGPLQGTPVMVLHPMMMPHISQADVDLCEDLGLRLIWPIRPGCLTVQGRGDKKWAAHCKTVVDDMAALHRMCIGTPVPIVALVSSGGYAAHFASQHPECVSQIDFVSTCFSAGKRPSRDVYFGEFLLRSLRDNARMAAVAIQHLVQAALSNGRFEKSLRKVFRGSAPDQALLDEDFHDPHRAARLTYLIRYSVESMRHDYLSQLHFDWRMARDLNVLKQFWHGVEDTVHNLDDLSRLALQVSGKAARRVPAMGHLTQGAALRVVLRDIAETYSN